MIRAISVKTFSIKEDGTRYIMADLISDSALETLPTSGVDVSDEGRHMNDNDVFAPGSTLWVPSKDKAFLYDGAAWCDVSKRFTYTHSFM